MDRPLIPGTIGNRRAGWLAAGGIAGALLASSCCVLPLVLVLAGVSGAWIGNLTALEPYTPLFAVVTLGLIAAGLWHAYRRQPTGCAEGACANTRRRTLTRVVLWAGAVLVILALTARWWAPIFY